MRKTPSREDETSSSPFASIVLKEKKEEAPKRQPAVKPKKPGEIVQGYDPGASFKDILYNWEHTGNPYALPGKGGKMKTASSSQSSTSFADIFAKWEGREQKKAEKGTYRRASEPYRPKKSFEEILSSYEGTGKADTQPRKVEAAASPAPVKGTTSLFREREDDDEIPDDVSWSVFSGARPLKRDGKVEDTEPDAPVRQEPVRRKSTYKATRDFSEILKEYEDGPSIARHEESVASVPEKKGAGAQEKVEKPTFFRQMEEDDEIPSGVSWSIFSGARDVARPEAIPEPADDKPADEKREEPRRCPAYKATKDFSQLLAQYESGLKPAKADEVHEPVVEKPAGPVHSEGRLFRTMDEDDEIPQGVAWSVFGGAQEVERPEETETQKEEPVMKKDEKPVVHEPYRATKDFSVILGQFDGLPPIDGAGRSGGRSHGGRHAGPTFDEILKEKGDVGSQKRERTLNELRIMMPQASLDLHGMTSEEADKALRSFVEEALSSGLEKIAIIHGKGLHSDGGVGVLRDVTLSVLDEMGACREVSMAKPACGGAGVTWVILKRTDGKRE